jgi:hypothetical protein
MSAPIPNGSSDWFVVAGAKSGDGSRDKPFHDPWLAIRAAGPGDVIHIAAGVYYGRYDRSSWTVDCPRLTIRGGYNNDFSRRAPWETPSVFAAFRDCESVRENNLLGWRGDHSGLTLDGLFFDASGRNTYGDKPGDGVRAYPAMDGPIASFNAEDVTIENCVFANSTAGGVELAGDGSRFENNLLINIIGPSMLSLRSAAGGDRKPVHVANNTFCFAHDVGDPPLGTGADRAIGVRTNRPAVVQDNVFVSCGNAAIEFLLDPERIAIDRNLFFATPRDIVNGRLPGNAIDIAESNIDELEDVGLKSAAGNVIQDPGIAGLKREWLDAYSRHLLANYAKPPREATNALRAAAGLPALTAADVETPESKGDLAPPLTPADALAIRFAATQGFHPIAVPTEISGGPAATHTYRPIDWSAIEKPDASLSNQRVELRAGLGFEQNTTLLADAGPATHMGIRIYAPGSDEGSIFVLARRHTLTNRQFEEAIKYTNGRDVENAYLLRGVYRTDIEPNSRQKVTLLIESIAPAPLVTAIPAARPEGRDWFVKAGTSGGDGTREKPFRDPFQALDKAEGGDAIHVAGGDYFGKLGSGQWKILVRYLTLLGGYDAEFASRDPWTNPTRFLLKETEKAKGLPAGTVLASEENSDGLIVDGFIFDGATYNTYTDGGSLDAGLSPTGTLVDLRGGRAPITIRNCAFLNASSAALSVSCPSGIFENNIVLNTSGWSMRIRADGPGPWIIRNNTILFAADPTERAGTGKSSAAGTLLHLTGRAVTLVESNILAFADNYGIRSTIAQQSVSFDGNVVAAHLFNYLTDTQYLWADASSWERRAVSDSAFASFKANQLELARLPLDATFADAALARLFTLPSRISADEWKAFAAAAGSSAMPVSSSVPAATTEAKPAVTAQSSLTDLLADLRQIQADESKKPVENGAPAYCPVFDWKKALALFQDTPVTEPGAHRVPLVVSFSSLQVKAQVEYMRVTPEQIDGDLAAFDNQPIEIEVKEARASSSNSSYYPAGLTPDNFDAYSVVTAAMPTRTRLAIIVRLDTAASKLLGRSSLNDTLRIRGTARLPRSSSALSIVIDTAERVES